MCYNAPHFNYFGFDRGCARALDAYEALSKAGL